MASELPHLLDTASKFALFSVSGLKDKKLIKKQTYMETETCKLYFGVFWIFLLNLIKIDPYNFWAIPFQSWCIVLRHSVVMCVVLQYQRMTSLLLHNNAGTPSTTSSRALRRDSPRQRYSGHVGEPRGIPPMTSQCDGPTWQWVRRWWAWATVGHAPRGMNWTQNHWLSTLRSLSPTVVCITGWNVC